MTATTKQLTNLSLYNISKSSTCGGASAQSRRIPAAPPASTFDWAHVTGIHSYRTAATRRRERTEAALTGIAMGILTIVLFIAGLGVLP